MGGVCCSTMRREAWATSTPTTAASAGRRTPNTVQPNSEARPIASGPTCSIFVYDLDANIPEPDLEQGLLGLFSVFGPVARVSCLPGLFFVCTCETLYSGWPHREPQAEAGFVRVTLAGWKDTAQAIVAFLNVEHSKQAMGRLQNFPIWGRPLRLAYSVEEGLIGRGDTSPSRKLDMERPATAPQQRAAPGNLTSPSGHVREAGARRRIWDVPTDPSPLTRKAPADSDYEHNESQCTVLSFLLCLGCAAPCRLHFLV